MTSIKTFAGRDREYLAASTEAIQRKLCSFGLPVAHTPMQTARVSTPELVEKTFAGNRFDRPTAHLGEVRFRSLSKDVAIEEGRCDMVCILPRSENTKSDATDRASMNARFVAVWMKQDDKWKLASLSEFADRPLESNGPTGSQMIAPLDRLTGRWKGTADKLTMQISASWNANKTFLSRVITVVEDGKEIFSGTQEVGWDPVSQSIKSWSFNADGGRSDATWDLDGASWVVVSMGIAADGQRTASTQFYKFRNKDTLECKRTNAQLGTQKLPDLAITLTRQSATK